MNKKNDKADSREFLELLIPNQRKLQAFILMLIPNIVDAEDIYQESVSEMWNKFSAFEIGTDFLAWAATIAKYKVLAFRNKHNKSKILFNSKIYEILESAANSTRDSLQKHLDLLKECIRKLSENEKYLLKMRYESDLTYQKIALRVGKTPPALHRTMSVIHSKLAICIRRAIRQEEVA